MNTIDLPGPRVPCKHCGGEHHVDQIVCDVDGDTTWTTSEGVELCKLIQNVSPKFNCHPALTGGLLYKDGPRKDCDIVIYQRGETGGERKDIEWEGLWESLGTIGLKLVKDHGYVKKCEYQGKTVDIFDPPNEGLYGGEVEEETTC